jgi:hypothetical protein
VDGVLEPLVGVFHILLHPAPDLPRSSQTGGGFRSANPRWCQ